MRVPARHSGTNTQVSKVSRTRWTEMTPLGGRGS
jgi:hypothetical protein